MSDYILAIDQGTTSSRAMIFDTEQNVVASAQQEFVQHFPRSGWVEHEPEDIWQSSLSTCLDAMNSAGLSGSDIAAIGITNQRETTLVWDKATGEPVYRAIVWQDRRSADICARLKTDGHEPDVTQRSGLLLDPYFSGTKLTWLFENVDGVRERAEAGALLFGTVDTWLIWKLTGGTSHVTDATNAARTLMFNIHDNDWDDELLRILGVPRAMLPEVKDCADDFGTATPDHFDAAIPVLGVAGDQHAALIGQACFKPGMMKSTYGTGCFAILNTGEDAVLSKNRLLTTIAYRLDGSITYALEGSIFVAGAAVQWLRDSMHLIARADQSGEFAAKADPDHDVYLVPAFTGLGAPHWDPDARGAMFGLTRATGPHEFARAALEAVCYQTLDLLDAMRGDWSTNADTVLRVDGGMVASDWTMQRLADILDAPVDRPPMLETTALGAAWLAGSKAGLWPDMKGFAEKYQCERQFAPSMESAVREKKIAGWADAVSRTLSKSS